MNIDDHISTLLFKTIIGTTTPDEEGQLAQWRSLKPEHEALYQRMLSHEHIDQLLRRRALTDTSRQLHDMQRWLGLERKHRMGWKRWAAAAAVVVVVACSATLMWMQHEQSRTAQVASLLSTDRTTIAPGESKALLTMPGGRQVALGTKAGRNEPSLLDRVVAAVDGGAAKQLCLDIPRGGEFKIVLEDSTEVWLNSESQLVYPEKFGESERRVTVKGEAYFKVAHDASRPFRVETDGQLVTVHGTEFNVRSRHEDNIVYTTLVKGSIALARKDGSGQLMLQPGHQSQFDKTDATTHVRAVDADVVTSWRYGKFVFENLNLEQVMQELSRWYNFSYQFRQESMRKIEFMGSIPRYSDFATALAILETSGGIHFIVNGNKVVVTK